MNRTVYSVMKVTAEIKNENELTPCCAFEQMDTNPEELAKFDNLEDAKEELKKYTPEIYKMNGYYLITEFAIDIHTEDEDGEFVEGSDFDTIEWTYEDGEVVINEY